MALSKSNLSCLSRNIQTLHKRGIDIQLEGTVATVNDPFGEFLGKHDFGENDLVPADWMGVAVLITRAWGKYVTQICKPDHQGVNHFRAEWVVESCEINGLALYDYKPSTFIYGWQIGSGEMTLCREERFNNWPAPSELLECQDELVRCYQKLKPLFDYLQKQGLQPVCSELNVTVGGVVLYCERDKLRVDLFRFDSSVEEPEGLVALSQGITVLNLIKDYFTREAREHLTVEKPEPSMTVEGEYQ